MEEEAKDRAKAVKEGEEWAAAALGPVESADAHNAGIPCPIKSACRVISRPARSAGLKWGDLETFC